MVLESRAGGRLRCLISHQDIYDVVATPIQSTMLEPVRYDMVLESRARVRLRCLIRSSTTL
eukprot:scaffold2337_cov89-Skeletonema_dohrnii-CCMP3373.AAC.1